MDHERMCGKGGPGRGDSRAKPLGAGERAWGALGRARRPVRLEECHGSGRPSE